MKECWCKGMAAIPGSRRCEPQVFGPGILDLTGLFPKSMEGKVIDLPTQPKKKQEKTIVFIDMDGVLTDFHGSKHFKSTDKVMRKPPRGYEEGFFESLPVLPGARWAIRTLLKNPDLDVRILTKPVWKSYLCYSEKVIWIAKTFPELLDKITITNDKTMLAAPGRILIDDYAQDWKEGWEAHGGRFIHFETYRSEEHWEEICIELSPDCFNIKTN